VFDHPDPGRELDWLAADDLGQLGIFSAGGWGLVPKSVIEHLADVKAAVEAVLDLEVIGSCLQPTADGDVTFWVEPAKRGFFGYDWEPVTPAYGRITVPSRAVLVLELQNQAIRRTAELVRIPGDFAKLTSLSIQLVSGSTAH
jgi:hypothetical protein